jgi:hypothetical protein
MNWLVYGGGKYGSYTTMLVNQFHGEMFTCQLLICGNKSKKSITNSLLSQAPLCAVSVAVHDEYAYGWLAGGGTRGCEVGAWNCKYCTVITF